MEHTIGYTLFGAGKLPEDVRASLEGDEVLLSFEGIPVKERFSGHVPGLATGGRTFGFSGSFVVTHRRVVGSLGSWVALDAPWDGGAGAPARAVLDASGLTLELDVARLNPEWHGSLRLHFEHALSEQDLARLPRRELGVSMTAEHVLQLAGARPKH